MYYGFVLIVARSLSVLLYLRLGVNCLLLVAFVVLIYVQYYHFQLQSLKKMDMYWLDPTLVVLNDKMRSDASLHFTLNGYCDYIRAVMGNYYVCCLLYGLKIHNSESLISLISFSSIDTIAEYLNHEDPFTEFTNRAHDDKDTIATNIQTTQKMIVQQLKRIRNIFTPTPKNNDVIVHISTQYVAVNTSPKEDEENKESVHIIPVSFDEEDRAYINAGATAGIDDDDTVYLIKPPPTKEAEEEEEETKGEAKEEDDDTNCIPSTLDFQRAAFNIKRFNPDVADKEAIFSALRAIGFDPYETTRGIIDLQNEQINQKLTRFEGVIDYLSLMGFQSDESDRFLVLVSANAEILHHAVYGLNGFLAPLMWSKPPKPQEEDETVVMEWSFSSPNARIHKVSLSHVQSQKSMKSERIICLDQIECYNEESAVMSFTIHVDDITAVIVIEKLDAMWSNEAYKYDLILDQEEYMKTFKQWESHIFESMLRSMPSEKEWNELRSGLLFHQEEYNKMVDLSAEEKEERKEEMKQHHQQCKQLEFKYLKYLKLIKSVNKPRIDFEETALCVYGWMRHNQSILPRQLQNLCIVYLAHEYQITDSPDLLAIFDRLNMQKTISQEVQRTVKAFIRQTQSESAVLPDWIQDICVLYVGEQHFLGVFR